MSGSDEAEPHAGESSGDERPSGGGKKAAGKKSSTRPAGVGRALRSVYDDTLREEIPSDLRDLLSRLA